jgi:LysR family hydrogen peroxide-inducible transcriptional activator
MTITQLEYFLAVVNHGSFSAAAEYCFVTQPSLSTQIGNLEEELGAVLLDRGRKPIATTQAGEIVLAQARRAVSEFYCTKELLNELRGELSGQLRLGVIPTISPYLMPGFVPQFVKRCPDVELKIRDMYTPDLIEALSRDIIDIAILSGGQSKVRIRETHLFNDRLYLYVSPKNGLFGRKKVVAGDIDPKQLLILSEGNCLRNQTLALCKARKAAKTQYDFANCSLETLMHTVDSTSTMTIVPGMAITYMSEERRRQIVHFDYANAHRAITMAVGHAYIRESLIDAVRDSAMAAAEEFAIAEFLVP